MDGTMGRLRVALQLDSAAFQSGMERAARQVDSLGVTVNTAQQRLSALGAGLDMSVAPARRVAQQLAATNDNAGAMRAGMQSLGFQLQDIAVQFASGQRASTIFAQQLPQVSGALSQMAQATGKTTGVVGALAGFMSGPWGVAVGVGAAVLSPLIAKLFETGNAAGAATNKVYGLQQALADMRTKPMEALGNLQNNVLGAEGALRRAEAMPRYTGGGSDQYKSNTYLEKARRAAIDRANYGDGTKENPGLIALRSELEVAKALEKTNQSLFTIATKAGKFRAVDIKGDDGGGGSSGSTRRAGKNAGKEYRSGVEDELVKLQQTTNDILASFKPFGDRTSGQLSGRADKRIEALRGQLGDVNIAMEKFGIEATDANQKVGESFQQMANDSLNSLRQLTSGIQSGDILGILGGLINTLTGLGGMGLFGKGVQASVAAFRAQPRAAGGPVSANQLYMVGERGPELFVPRGSGSIVPNHALNGGGSMQVQVVPSPYFDVRVLQNVAGVAPMIANAGADLGNSRMAKAGRRRLA